MIEEPDWSEIDTTIRPHRKDGYVPRTRVQVRIDDASLARLDALAESLSLSRAHLADLILNIAAEEGSDWLRGCLLDRITKALQLRRSKFK